MKMYTIIDLKEHKSYSFDTREEVANWWSWHAGRANFSELNMTGKELSDKYTFKDGMWKPELRRYMVYCCGHLDDIRRWPDSVWPDAHKFAWQTTAEPHEFYFGRSGKKVAVRRCSGPSMYRGMLRAACDDRYTDSDELDVAYPVPPVRNKDKKETFLYAGDERMWDHSNSWKRRSRCKKQYMRHKGKHSNTAVCRKRVIDPEWLEEFDDGALAA